MTFDRSVDLRTGNSRTNPIRCTRGSCGARRAANAAELDKAKRYLTGQFPLGLQAPDELAAQLLTIEFYGLDPHYLEAYADHVNAVTLADVRRVLKDRFGVGDLRILVVSNPDSARAALAGLRPIAVQPLR